MARQKITLECDETVMAEVLAITDARPDTLVQVPQVERAFKLLETLPSLDAGYLQHVLLVALNEKGLCLYVELAEALAIVPALLKGLALPPEATETVVELGRKLVEIAHRDERFLQHYLDGKPRAAMF